MFAKDAPAAGGKQRRYPCLAGEAHAARQAEGEQRADERGAAADDPALGAVAEFRPGEGLP
jgi:hypothetical protein